MILNINHFSTKFRGIKTDQNDMDYYLCSISMADLLFAMTRIFNFIAELLVYFKRFEPVCYIQIIVIVGQFQFNALSDHVSSWTILVMAYTRYRKIIGSSFNMDNCKPFVINLIIWTSYIVLQAHLVAYSSYYYISAADLKQQNYNLFICVLQTEVSIIFSRLFISVSASIYLYFKICQQIWKNPLIINNGLNYKKKCIIFLLTISAGFFLNSAGLLIQKIFTLNKFGSSNFVNSLNENDKNYIFYVNLVMMLRIYLNPIAYLYFYPDFRNKFKCSFCGQIKKTVYLVN